MNPYLPSFRNTTNGYNKLVDLGEDTMQPPLNQDLPRYRPEAFNYALPFGESSEIQPTKNVYVVAHSNLMQTTVNILEIQQRLANDFLAQPNVYDFDFDQNVWTMQLYVDKDSSLQLKKMYTGVKKPEMGLPAKGNQPGTKILMDKECSKDSSAIPKYIALKSASLALKTRQLISRNQVSLKYRGEHNLNDVHVSNFKYIAKYDFDSYPEPVQFKGSENMAVYVTRHATSCNNIADNFFYKKYDPSIAEYGVWSLKDRMSDPNFQPFQLAKQRKETEVVYVSSCIRTWMTAILIYWSQGRTLHLVVSPFLKEKGNNPGNLPESISQQLAKIQTWMVRNGIPAINVKISIVDSNDQLVQIHPSAGSAITLEYTTQHLRFYPDGILQFVQWVKDRNDFGFSSGGNLFKKRTVKKRRKKAKKSLKRKKNRTK